MGSHVTNVTVFFRPIRMYYSCIIPKVYGAYSHAGFTLIGIGGLGFKLQLANEGSQFKDWQSGIRVQVRIGESSLLFRVGFGGFRAFQNG